MALLNRSNRQVVIGIALTSLLTTSCGVQTVVQQIPLSTDTYITTADTDSHAAETTLKISKSGGLEERIILKLPTQEKTGDQILNDIYKDFLFLFYMPIYILSRFANCQEDIVQPENLTLATLDLDVYTSLEADLTNKIQMDLLTKPWYQTVSWTRAHPFSSLKGNWTTAGGDVDNTFTALNSTYTNVSGVKKVSFDITNYFKNLITAQGKAVHYGFLLSSKGGAALGATEIKSTQVTDLTTKPRVEATYTGKCTGLPSSNGYFHRTYILGEGAEPSVVINH